MLHPFKVLPLLLAGVSLVAQEPSFDTLREEGRWKQLRPRIEGWARMKPEDPYALMWMSRLKLAFGDTNAALDLARKAVSLRPTDGELQTQLGVAADAARNKVSFLKQLPLALEMKNALVAAVKANPRSNEANNLLMRYYLAAPGFAGGSVAKAKEIADQFSKVNPAHGMVFTAMIAVYKEDQDGAMGILQQAIAADPRCLMAYRELTNLYMRKKPQSLDEAMDVCRRCIAANPKAIEAYATLAAILAFTKRNDEADRVVAQARQQCPDNLWPCYAAAVNFLASGQLEKVEPYLRTYLSQEPEGGSPDHASAHALLGRLYGKQNRKAEAIQSYERALQLRPGEASFSKELAQLRKG